MKPTLALSLVLLAGGCSVGPSYTAPQPTAPTAWNAIESGAVATGVPSQPQPTSPDLASWWKVFADPTLDSLVERALRANPSLREAAARVREARALRGISDSKAYPTLDARAAAARSRGSENINGGSFNDHDTSLYSVGLDASWEIDVFGGVRREIEAADADLASATEASRDVMISLLAEVARNYSEARGFQRRIDVTRSSIKVQEDTVQVAQARLNAGIASELDLTQARALLETRRAALPILLTGLQQSLHRLGVLIGEGPGALTHELGDPGPIPPVPAAVPVGLPSDLLRRRPDIRRAERDLASATARIGVAQADLYPRFSLTGSFGFLSNKPASLLDLDSRAWSVGPSVRWNVFDMRRTRFQIEAAGEREKQALARYDATVLSAFEEVENRLVAFTQEQSRRASLAQAVLANQRAVQLSDDLYKAGVRDFLNVLDSQRALFDSTDALVQSDIAVTTNLIALYKALGGGWDAGSDAPSDAPPSAPGQPPPAHAAQAPATPPRAEPLKLESSSQSAPPTR